jgi:hypothetical protein
MWCRIKRHLASQPSAKKLGELGYVEGQNIAPEMNGKRLELLREIVPGLTRVAVLWSRQAPYQVALLHETDEAAQALGVAAVPIESSDDIEDAFRRNR